MPLIRNKPDRPPITQESEPATLSSASAEERWRAARAAADSSANVPALSLALARESDPRVREAIFTALARIATAESAQAVLPYLRSDDANIRIAALDALLAMPRAAEAHLPLLLSDPEADVRLLACELVRKMQGENGPRQLHSLLEAEPQANVCAAAVEVLAEVGDAEALPPLRRCLARFPDDPFLNFAITVAIDHLGARSPRSRD